MQGSLSIHAANDILYRCHSSIRGRQPLISQRTNRCSGRRTIQCKASRQETAETLQPASRLRSLGSWLQKPKAPKPVPVDTKPPLRLPFQPEDPERGLDLSQLSYIWGLGILSVCYLHHSTTGYELSHDQPQLKSVSRRADFWTRQVCSASYASTDLSRLEAHRQPGSSADCGLHGVPSSADACCASGHRPGRSSCVLLTAQPSSLVVTVQVLYAFALIPVGFLADKANRPRMLAGGATLWSLLSMGASKVTPGALLHAYKLPAIAAVLARVSACSLGHLVSKPHLASCQRLASIKCCMGRLGLRCLQHAVRIPSC